MTPSHPPHEWTPVVRLPEGYERTPPCCCEACPFCACEGCRMQGTP